MCRPRSLFKTRQNNKYMKNPTEKCKNTLVSLLSHQRIPSFSTPQDMSNGAHFQGELSGDSCSCPFQASPAAQLSPRKIQSKSG
jgi:hypothetical protein